MFTRARSSPKGVRDESPATLGCDLKERGRPRYGATEITKCSSVLCVRASADAINANASATAKAKRVDRESVSGRVEATVGTMKTGSVIVGFKVQWTMLVFISMSDTTPLLVI
jgi:hypothetical protein